ncbi:hypothetical protein BN59_02739 [Legionella massiliensis]|uniref:Uncharacterized protein n=1 Tax=Legionella massiliensis TaxID=1034943 RepID=A0A078L2V9_9GAMM|nr:DUF5630 domain-containing protein [Legionella massiliensis]CDZ78429.1 hypothetical protein BN59_02739 [Legionella massiliensis]CEE14167.1 hypothetical protein BN1094_02739 [Legionella massiliensis]
MYQFNRIFTLDNLLKLNSADYLFITRVNSGFYSEKDYLKKFKVDCDLNFIVKIAKASKKFEEICRQEQYNDCWNEQYQILGNLISINSEKPISFNTHDSDCFDLLRGELFFYYSQLELIKSKKDFSLDERLFLQEAIQYKSVHAIQRYHAYLNQQIESNVFSSAETAAYFGDMIKNCKSILELYGSYAYLMLAETYYNYAQWLRAQGKEDLVPVMVKAALTCCMAADDFSEASVFSIHNASFGKGLEESNSLKLMPDSFIKFLTDWIQHEPNDNSLPESRKL